MYTRISRSGGRSYLQIVEGYRSDSGAVRQRVIANLGRLDRLEPSHLDPLINGLNRALGRVEPAAVSVEYDSARAFGDVYALHALWGELGFAEVVRRALRSSRREFDAEALVRAMVPVQPSVRGGLQAAIVDAIVDTHNQDKATRR